MPPRKGLQQIVEEWESEHLATEVQKGLFHSGLTNLRDAIENTHFAPKLDDFEFLASITGDRYKSWLHGLGIEGRESDAYQLIRESMTYMLVGKLIKLEDPELKRIAKTLWFEFHNNMERYSSLERNYEFNPATNHPDVWQDPKQVVRNRYRKIDNARDPVHYHRKTMNEDQRETYAFSFERYLDIARNGRHRITPAEKIQIVDAIADAYNRTREIVARQLPTKGAGDVILRFGVNNSYGQPIATLYRIVHKETMPPPRE